MKRLAVALLCLAAPARAAPQWLRGQTHVHSANSGDSKTPPSDVVRWYSERGYDFIVLTDHNRITVVDGGKLLALPGVELTQNLKSCVPAPVDSFGCLLHMNALAVTATTPPEVVLPASNGKRRIEVYTREYETAAKLGGVAQLNHPNFHSAANAELVVELAKRGPLLLEVANQALDSENGADANHPSTEALWDKVLSAGAEVWAVASDDAHHYDDAEATRARGEPVFTGDRGFVMVYAERSADGIREALKRGHFYASTGPRLRALNVDGGVLFIGATEKVHFTFVGKGGKTLAESDGAFARFPLQKARGGYVRTVITDAAGRKAWTQPIRVK